MLISKNFVSGLVFVATAVIFGLTSIGYDLGTTARVGPGMFPLILSAVLGVLGIAVMASGLRADAVAFGSLPWRAIALIVASPLVFVGSIGFLGLVPAAALLAFIGSFASRTMTPRRAALCAVGLAAAVWLIFTIGLGIPIPAFGWRY